MANKLTELKDWLLSKYTQFNNGFANVVKLEDKDIQLDEKTQLYAGIEDTKGNYFYIRATKQSQLDAMRRGARVAYYKKTTDCRIVGIMINGDADILTKMLINGVTANKHFVTSINTDNTSVFKEETGKNLTRKEFAIVAVDFEIIEIVSPRDCSLNPCNC